MTIAIDNTVKSHTMKNLMGPSAKNGNRNPGG